MGRGLLTAVVTMPVGELDSLDRGQIFIQTFYIRSQGVCFRSSVEIYQGVRIIPFRGRLIPLISMSRGILQLENTYH